jgi:hypothetical protein
MARQWSIPLSLLLAGALAASACAAGEGLGSDPNAIVPGALGGTTLPPSGTAGAGGTGTTPIPPGGTIVPPVSVGTPSVGGTASGMTPRPGTAGGISGTAAAGGGISGTAAAGGGISGTVAAGGTASGTAGGTTSGTGTVDAGIAPPVDAGPGTRTDAGAVTTGGGGGTAGAVSGGDCCPDGNCLCSTPPPARLSAAKGPFKTASLNFASGTAYYPTDGKPPYGGVAIIPGFTNIGPEMEEWGPFYASWGIVCVITSSGPLDTPSIRAVWLGDAVKEMKAENMKAGSKLNGKMAGRYGTSGYSMGGGGTTYATDTDKTLKTSIGLAPWSPIGAGITTPTLHFCGSIDIVADCSHAQWSYDAIPAATPKMMMTISGCDHLTCWFGPNDTGGHSGGWGLAFQKVYLEGDTRWKALLLSKPTGATVQTNIKM